MSDPNSQTSTATAAVAITASGNPVFIQLPTLAQQLVKAFAQKGLTALAAFMVTKGILVDGQTAQFVDLGISVALGAASFAWTYYHEKHVNVTTNAALNTPTTLTVVK